MSELTDSLREHATHTLMDASRDLLRKAADEIEMLNAAIAANHSTIWRQSDENRHLRLLVQALRDVNADLDGKLQAASAPVRS
jgi:uncharacterized coiled-coil protein SlyX